MKHLRYTPLLLSCCALPAFAEDVINYKDHVRPILQQSCFNCHNADKSKGGLDLTSFNALMSGSSTGEIVASQDPGASTLLGVMAHTLEPKMPPSGGRVEDKQIEVIRKWIEQGLRESASSEVAKPKQPGADLSVGKAAMGRPDGPPIMPTAMPMGPIYHTPRAGAVVSIAGHPWSPIAAVAGQKQVLVYHTDTGELLGVLPFEYGQPKVLRFSWTGQLLLIGGGVDGKSGTVALYDVKSGRQVTRIGDEVDAVLAADLDPTQRYLALGGPNKLVKGYDVTTGELIYKIDKHTEWVTAIAFSPDGKSLATGDRNGGLMVWEADTGLPVLTLDGHKASVTAIAWRYDGKMLATAGEDGQAKLWEAEDGKQVKAWNAHAGGAQSIAFAEDGRVVTTGRDQLVRVWDANGNALKQTKAFDDIGLSAAFDTTGQVVLAGDLSGRLVRWSLADKADQLAELSSNPPTVQDALAQRAEAVGATALRLEQARAELVSRQSAMQLAEQSHAQAQQALQAARQAVPDGEARIKQMEQARKQAFDRREQANQAMRTARSDLGKSSDQLRAMENESNRVKREHERVSKEIERLSSDLSKLQEQAELAIQKANENPEDKGAANRVKELARQIETKQKDANKKAGELDQWSESIVGAEQKLDASQKDVEAKRAAVDQAQQMIDAVNQEAQDAGTAVDAARKALEEARLGIKPAEAKLEQAVQSKQETAKTAAQAEQALQQAEQAAQRAVREQKKWQAAAVRQQIDVLRQRQAEQSNDKAIQIEIDKLEAHYQELRAEAGLQSAE